MACDRTYQLKIADSGYRPFIPLVNTNKNCYQLPLTSTENKLIFLCRCACRNLRMISGGLRAV